MALKATFKKKKLEYLTIRSKKKIINLLYLLHKLQLY